MVFKDYLTENLLEEGAPSWIKRMSVDQLEDYLKTHEGSSDKVKMMIRNEITVRKNRKSGGSAIAQAAKVSNKDNWNNLKNKFLSYGVGEYADWYENEKGRGKKSISGTESLQGVFGPKGLSHVIVKEEGAYKVYDAKTGKYENRKSDKTYDSIKSIKDVTEYLKSQGVDVSDMGDYVVKTPTKEKMPSQEYSKYGQGSKSEKAKEAREAADKSRLPISQSVMKKHLSDLMDSYTKGINLSFKQGIDDYAKSMKDALNTSVSADKRYDLKSVMDKQLEKLTNRISALRNINEQIAEVVSKGWKGDEDKQFSINDVKKVKEEITKALTGKGYWD